MVITDIVCGTLRCLLLLQGFDVEALMTDVQELKSVVKQQELRIRELEATLAEKQAASSCVEPASPHDDDDEQDDE